MKRLFSLFLLFGIMAPALAFGQISYIGIAGTGPNLGSYAGNIIPSVDDTYDSGSSTLKWNELFVSEANVYSITALDGTGLSLLDDGLNLGIHVEDGGQVGIGDTAPSEALSVSGTTGVDGNGDGTPDFYVASDGEVGIGTVDPDYPLHVYKGGTASIFVEALAGNYANLYLGDNGSATQGGLEYNNSDDSLAIRVNNGPKIKILSTGSVGIATTAPAEPLQVSGNVRIDGDLYFSGTGSGLAFGGMSMYSNTTATAFSAANTFTPLAPTFMACSPSNLVTCAVEAGGYTPGELTVTNAGVYMVTASLSFSGSNGDLLDFTVYVNDTTIVPSIHIPRRLGNNDIGALALSGLVRLAAGDKVEVWVQNSGDSNSITIDSMNIAIAQVGG